MNFTKAVFAFLAFLVAGSAFAALTPEHQAFGNGPARHYMTKDDLKQWKTISSDDQAQAFIDLFWARRDPTPATPRNEFRQDFDALVALANKQFTVGQTPGSMTERGRFLILFGAPTKIVRTKQTAPTAPPGEEPGGGEDSTLIETWLYTGDHIPSFAPKSDMSIIFEDGKLGRQRWNVIDLVQKAINSSIVSPDMKELPKYAQAQPAPKPAAQPGAPAGLTSDALKAVVEEVKAGKGEYPNAPISYDEFVTPTGTHYVPVSIYVPKSAGLTADSAVTFFGVVSADVVVQRTAVVKTETKQTSATTSESVSQVQEKVETTTGGVVTSYEEPARLTATKNDYFFDKSLTLAPGKYTAVFGLAREGKAVVVSSVAMEIAGREKDAVAVSKLILSNNIYPLTAAQAPTDPYSFGGIKVVPKSDRTFTKLDDLWYFVELQNPGLDPTTNAPKIQLKLDLEGTAGKEKVKMGAPLAEAPAEALKGVPGHYGVGSSIPLASFKPGDYTLKIKLMDTVNKQTYNMEQGFKVVGEK